ncbi:efflux RND transporter periplasmic adaptor subunit [Flexithrix dorotheae]|uniref:efflux RND transporter periplasmic adaptor subunit n=1 Tax=Flexithrix dorotheae TaxID=70993 RepID=UPI000372C5C7|nr:efflux RND transporter periplasmic adaptor subunit [Flexithrix dorotheae]
MQRKLKDWLVIMIGSVLFFTCSSKNTSNHIKTAGLQNLPVVKLISMDTLLIKEYVAEINAVKHVEIRGRVGGFLDKIYVDEGEEVRKGQALFRINSEEYEAELAKQKANLESAIANAKAAALEVDRVKLLVEKNVISNSELEVAKAKHSAAKARIDEARSAHSNAAIRLSYTYLKSPFDGIIDRIPLKPGSLINSGELLTKISDNSQVYAYFNVSESEYLNYQKNLASGVDGNKVVRLTLADGTVYPYPGKIETMEGEINSSTGTIAFRAIFPNPDKILKHGSTGKITLTNNINNALLLPQKAAFEIQDRQFVYVLDETNKVKIRSFQPETRFSHFYIVRAGLKSGDRIIYEGIQNLKEGMEINPIYYDLDSLIKAASDGKVVF